MRILIVEDDSDISELLTDLLEAEKYVVDCQPRIDLALEAIINAEFNLVILDRTLPDGDGLRLIKALSNELPAEKVPPFLILSALNDTADKVKGLDAGAVDYLGKPYEPEELLARIRSGIRRAIPSRSLIIKLGNSDYNPVTYQLLVNGVEVQLRRKEIFVFDVLMRNHNKIISHDKLEQAVYSYDEEISSNTLKSHVSRVRKALRYSNSDLKIDVVRHIGYILKLNT